MQREERIEALVAAMTLDEKIGQLTMSSAPDIVTGPLAEADLAREVREGAVGSLLNLVGGDAIRAMQDVAVRESRLGIPLLFGLDVVHGYRTVLPVPLGEGAAMDPALWEATAGSPRRRRARDGIDLTFAPMIDVCRDPRWGRVVECPGEDPWLASLYARAKVRGFQGARRIAPAPMRWRATAKHIGGYGAVTAGPGLWTRRRLRRAPWRRSTFPPSGLPSRRGRGRDALLHRSLRSARDGQPRASDGDAARRMGIRRRHRQRLRRGRPNSFRTAWRRTWRRRRPSR